ncbi:lamin tail domain-containing protein, partial [Patescibacteria group bacterium]
MLVRQKIFTIFLVFSLIFCICFGLNKNVVQANELININIAGLEELDSLPGIGASKAQSIIDYRNENGDFNAIEDIMNVSGIGQSTFENIQDLITVEGNGEQNNNDANIVINEVLPNPEGSDSAEWIELKNLDDTSVNLSGWKISDTSKTYIIDIEDFTNTSISTGSFFILEKSITGISLNNSGGETISLYDNEENLISQINYSESAEEDVSWARKDNTSYAWTNVLTKNKENEFNEDAGDGNNNGSGNGGENEESNDDSEDTGAEDETETEYKSKYAGRIIFNELMINPNGIDDGFNEWIELYNNSNSDIFISNWKLKDNSGEYVFNKKISARSWLVLRREQTNLFLNNLGDKLELLDGLDDVVDFIEYTKSYENKSYNWCEQENKWMWMDEVSVGMVNNCPIDNI